MMGLATLAERPDLRLLVLLTDREVGGRDLELVLPDRLPATATALLELAIVREWSGHLVVSQGKSRKTIERTVLIDPVQLWLELRERVGDAPLIVSCGSVLWEDGWLSWGDGDARVGELIDLSALSFPSRQSDIVEAGALRDLDLPVLADFDAGGEAWHYLQYVPLGGDRVAIQRVAREKQPWMLRAPDTIEDLPTIAAMARLCDLVAQIAEPRALLTS